MGTHKNFKNFKKELGLKIYLILHNIRSLHNVGSIFRTADAMGIKKIYLTGYTPGPYDFFEKIRKDFQKTALGAEKYIAWEKVKNISTLLGKLKKENAFIVSLEQAKSAVSLASLGVPTAKSGIAVILGNEVNGLPKTVLKKSDVIVEIPMLGKKESLNVSVAAGIVLYAIVNLWKK